MPNTVTSLKVFIASPGNLQPERKIFRDAVHTHNDDDGHELGVSFVPRGLEFAFSGVGRPQELINQQVRESDYAIVVFWDKWGQPTEHYSSGTEEEFNVAITSLLDKNLPMRDVVVFFKGVDDRQLSDPGPELNKVLSFKKDLEEKRQALYRNFDSETEFRDEVIRQLQRWTREWSHGNVPAKATLPRSTAPTDRTSLNPAAGGTPLEKAIIYAHERRSTEAEQLFAQVITLGYDREAYSEYAKFLRKEGRYSASETTSQAQVQLARDNNDMIGAVEGLQNLGTIKRLVGERRASETFFKEALRLMDQKIASEGRQPDFLDLKASILDNMSLTLRKTPHRIDDAQKALEDAIEIRKDLGDGRGWAFSLRTLGLLLTQRGSLDRAQKALEEALEIFVSEGYDRGKAQTLTSLGEVYELKEEWPKAESAFEESLAINVAQVYRQGRSMNHSQLSRVRLAQGRVEDARLAAEACMEMNEIAGSEEGLAAGLHALGRVLRAEGSLDAADDYLEQALDSFTGLDQPVGKAATLVDLASVAVDRRDKSAATRLLNDAAGILKDTPHFGIERAMQKVLAEVSAI